jgi:glycosyltransferase involved in cell wall biosynthesis
LKLLIDLQGAQTESRFRGIGRYSTSLAQAMARNAGEHEVWVAVNGTLGDGIQEIRQALDGLIPAERIQAFDGLPRIGWPDPANTWRRNAAELAREAFIAALRPDVVHVSSLFEGSQDCAVSSIGKLEGGPLTAVTLYDLIPLLNEETYLTSEWTRNWYMDKVASLQRADLLLSISGHAREEALQALPLDPDSVVNMSSAISPHFVPRPVGTIERDLLDARFGIVGPYIMYSGAMEPRKNADRLLQAFSLLEPDLRESTQLVIAGKVAPHDMVRFCALADELGVSGQVKYTGYITDDELILLYSAAAVYVFPSLHEGFGLPALEAMACGAPTIGSATTSVPEVIGRKDALFDPSDATAIAASIRRVLVDVEFARSLREHAPKQAARFSWDATAKTAIAAFERLVGQREALHESWPQARPRLDEGYRKLVAAIGAAPGREYCTPHDRALASTAVARNCERLEHLFRSGPLPKRIHWRIEGPFDSSYSLALVNRELALAMAARGHEAVLHSTEGPGDFPADENFLRENPDVALLHERVRDHRAEDADVCSRLIYPPRVTDMSARQNYLHLYAWEETQFPHEWVDDFNSSLQGITCLSDHVRKVLIDNGVSVPLTTGGCGVDHWLSIESDASYVVKARRFRFLHVSSCFPRKGADAMLKAYGAAFTSRDDVSLVIKTFANPHNEIHKWLEEAQRGRDDFPHVCIIEQDLSDAQLKSVYSQCHALVAPSRAEGFGLPLAEAILSGLQVITTGWSGQLAFCNEETAWLVDYEFARAQSHFALPLSAWAEPSVESLTNVMRAVHAAPPEVCRAKLDAGISLLERKFRWSDIAENVERGARQFATTPQPIAPKVGWVTSWNTRCGVATYSSNLVAGWRSSVSVLAAEADDRTFADEGEVFRCWRQGDGQTLDRLSAQVEASRLDALIIQFQYSFFDFDALDAFIREQKEAGRTVIVMMHATTDSPLTPRKRLARLSDALQACDRVLVHAIADLNRLKRIGVVDNVALFPHGIMDTPEPPVRSPDDTWTIASYGFFLPHKGLPELIAAIAHMRKQGVDVRLKMLNAEYPVPESRAQIAQAHMLISQLGLQDHVSLVTEFLRDEESMAALVEADVVVFPYQGTGESASGAVRYGLASGRPVAVTPLPIFDDVAQLVHRLPGTAPEELAAGLTELLQGIAGNAPEVGAISEAAGRWRQTHRYSALATRLYNMTTQLHASPRID